MIKRGLMLGECPELWNLNRPDDVRVIAKAYKEAGADIILTNTFGGSRFKLKRSGISSNIKQINKRGVQLSREVCGLSLRWVKFLNKSLNIGG